MVTVTNGEISVTGDIAKTNSRNYLEVLDSEGNVVLSSQGDISEFTIDGDTEEYFPTWELDSAVEQTEADIDYIASLCDIEL